MQKQCEQCGVSFEVDDAKRNWRHVKFCSKDCQKAKSTQAKRAKYKPQEWPQHRKCVRCDTSFIVEGPNGSQQEYCSKTCYREGRNQDRLAEVEKRRQSKVCSECNTAFIPTRYHQKTQVYCSKSCYWKASRSNSIAAANRLANQTEWQRAKRIAAKRDGDKCRFCGKQTTKIQVHHLDFSGGKEVGNHHPDNLITLCVPCHKAVHHVALVPHGDGWAVKGKIFEILKLAAVEVIP